MPYIINKSDGTPLVTLSDGTVDTTTSVGLIGRNYVGYGEIQNENFLFLLENFANTTPPSAPITGQTWFNTQQKILNVYTGETWIPINSALVQATEPAVSNTDGNSVIGSGVLWFKTTTKQLYLFNGTDWSLIGPNGLENFGITDIRADTVVDTNLVTQPILKAYVDDTIVSIFSKNSFRINPSNSIQGFLDISAGITLYDEFSLTGNLIGNASSASRLETPRTINGFPFDGTANIQITSSTTGSLEPGSYIIGSSFSGTTTQTWSVDATKDNVANKIVVRGQNGDFAAETITATKFIGTLDGNVSTALGTSKFNVVEANEFRGVVFSGNAFSASKLLPGSRINGVLFTGVQDITVPVSGMDITGNRLAPTVKESELESLGVLNDLRVQTTGITVGNNNLKISVDQSLNSLVTVNNGQKLQLSIADQNQPTGKINFEFMNSVAAFAEGGTNNPAFVGNVNAKTNLGLPTRKFANVYSDFFVGVSTSAQYADLAENYVADQDYDPGTVLEFSGKYEVTVADYESPRVAGVVSMNPAYLMNSGCKGEYVVPLALQGRVFCKVKGKVKKGDIMVSAGDGYAKSSENPKIGTIIGKSIEDFNEETGVIEIVVGRI